MDYNYIFYIKIYKRNESNIKIEIVICKEKGNSTSTCSKNGNNVRVCLK
jgi:hypothetical protein